MQTYDPKPFYLMTYIMFESLEVLVKTTIPSENV
jgi:hypothetical protein